MPDCNTTGERKMKWTVDHDHKTGAVRGILCNPCNVRLAGYESGMRRRDVFQYYLATPPAGRLWQR